MSLEPLKAFLEKVKGDKSLKDILNAANTAEDVVGIAKEYGHEFTADKVDELTEEELEAVAGGAHCDTTHPGTTGVAKCCCWSASLKIFFA